MHVQGGTERDTSNDAGREESELRIEHIRQYTLEPDDVFTQAEHVANRSIRRPARLNQKHPHSCILHLLDVVAVAWVGPANEAFATRVTPTANCLLHTDWAF